MSHAANRKLIMNYNSVIGVVIYVLFKFLLNLKRNLLHHNVQHIVNKIHALLTIHGGAFILFYLKKLVLDRKNVGLVYVVRR